MARRNWQNGCIAIGSFMAAYSWHMSEIARAQSDAHIEDARVIYRAFGRGKLPDFAEPIMTAAHSATGRAIDADNALFIGSTLAAAGLAGLVARVISDRSTTEHDIGK